MTNSAKELDLFMRCYAKALESHSWCTIEPLLWNDACFVFSEGTYIGKDKIKDAIEKTFKLIADEKYCISNITWIYKSATAALCFYEFSWKGFIAGVAESGTGRGSTLLVSDGEVWKIMHEHLGPSPSF